jgi:5-methylcytosine-specific restriction protein A
MLTDSENLSNALAERFGLCVSATLEQVADGHKFIIRPEKIEHTISFQIELILGWRSISAIFRPGNYASSLLKSMNSATTEQKSAFAVFASSLQSKGAKVQVLLDSLPVEATTPLLWPNAWSNITISMKKIGVVIENDYDFIAAFPWATGFFGMVLALLPLEEVPEENIILEEEGAISYKLVKRYERSRINRAACIEIHGTCCKICGFSFEKIFGKLGDGYIHVHHIVPVSEMLGSYTINPGTDLIPICPNCHTMIHRVKPSMSPDTLKKLLLK